MKAAAVDIGTNSVKMVIGWKKTDENFEYREEPPVVTRLGKGVDAAGHLNKEAIERTLKALAGFAEKAKAAGVTTIKAVGTSALRDAANGADFIRQAEATLGGKVEIISGDREADLIYKAARHEAVSIAPKVKTIVTTDVGGGSTEIVVGQGEKILYRQSLQMGAVRLTERAIKTDPPTAEELSAAEAIVDSLLAQVPHPEGDIAIIASGGTAASLGAMQIVAEIPQAESEAVFAALHGMALTQEQISERIKKLALMPLAERRKTPGLEPDRADVIIAGAIIQSCILRHLQTDRLFVSARGLRYGLLNEMLSEPDRTGD